MSSKFGLQLVFDILKTMTSPSPKLEVVLHCCSNCDKFNKDSCHITVILHHPAKLH